MAPTRLAVCGILATAMPACGELSRHAAQRGLGLVFEVGVRGGGDDLQCGHCGIIQSEFRLDVLTLVP
jgi:hypothetical protein